MRIQGIIETTIYVDDLQAAETFYGTILSLRVYGAFWDMVIERDGMAVVRSSAERYLRAIGR